MRPASPLEPELFTLEFWKDTTERAVATAAQSAIAVWGVSSTGLLDTDLGGVLLTAAGGAVLSVLKSLAASRLNDPNSASLVDLPGKHAAE
jgi:hypothetical protein